MKFQHHKDYNKIVRDCLVVGLPIEEVTFEGNLCNMLDNDDNYISLFDFMDWHKTPQGFVFWNKRYQAIQKFREKENAVRNW